MSDDRSRLDVLAPHPPGPAVLLLAAGAIWLWYAANILVHLDVTGATFDSYVDRAWLGVLVICAVGAATVLVRSPAPTRRRLLWAGVAGLAGLVGTLASGAAVWRAVVVALAAALVVLAAWRLFDLTDRPEGSEPPAPTPRGPRAKHPRSTHWDALTLGTTFRLRPWKGLMWLAIGVVVGIPFGVVNLVFRLGQAEAEPQPLSALVAAVEPAVVGELVLRLALGGLWFAAMRGRRRTSWSVVGLYVLLTVPFAMVMMTDVLVSTPAIGVLGILANAVFTGIPLTFLATQINVQSAVGFHWALVVLPLMLGV